VTRRKIPRIGGSQVTPSSIWPHRSAATPSPRGPEPSACLAAHASIHKQSECEVTPGHICRVPRDHASQRPNDPLCELSGLLSRIPKDGSENLPRPRCRNESRTRARRKNDDKSIGPTTQTVKPRDFGIRKSNFFAQYPSFFHSSNDQAGKAGSLGKTARINAIHATGQADIH
jgi:hypothetical protein